MDKRFISDSNKIDARVILYSVMDAKVTSDSNNIDAKVIYVFLILMRWTELLLIILIQMMEGFLMIIIMR